jgi:inosine/xanthosine triphosphatase
LIIAIGSTNQAKVQALAEVIREYPILATAQIMPLSTPSKVSDQPLSLSETIDGAKNRASGVFHACSGCTYGFGIESGMIEAPGTQTGFFCVTVCSIYNGSDFHMGMSTGFEVPSAILKLMLEKKIDMTQACLEAGISQNALLVAEEGLIGILTSGRIDRKHYTKECIITALTQLEHARWFATSEQPVLHNK